MKTKFIALFKDIAIRVAELSTARRLKVGAIVVKDDRIISIGYNGMPAGWDNNCEEWVDLTPEERIWSDADRVLRTRPEVLHAESNAISKMARSSESAEGADLFVTHSPCMECAKLIYQSGIRNVWFGENYRSDSGLQFLRKSGVEVKNWNNYVV